MIQKRTDVLFISNGKEYDEEACLGLILGKGDICPLVKHLVEQVKREEYNWELGLQEAQRTGGPELALYTTRPDSWTRLAELCYLAGLEVYSTAHVMARHVELPATEVVSL